MMERSDRDVPKEGHTSQTIVVRYPSGREDRLQVHEGRSVIGSSEDCDIVISDPSVSKRHLILISDVGGLEVERASEANAVWLNEDLLSGRAPFVAGDQLRIGGVAVFVQGIDGTKSPDGTRKMRESVARDLRAGWLGYRRIMEKLACFVSPEEALIASDCYMSGRRAFFAVLLITFAGGVLTSSLEFAQWYRSSAVVGLLLECFSNAAILFLAGRYGMSFAGRILFPLMLLSQSSSFLTPETACSGYWDSCCEVVLCVVGFGFALGWMLDYGAGFVREKKSLMRGSRIAVLGLASCLSVVLPYLADKLDFPQPIPWCWSIFVYLPCLIWVFAHKKILSLWGCVPADAFFVAEIASRRSWRRVLCQVLSLVLLVIPAICVLSILGDDERRQWPRVDSDVLWTDVETKDEAWFWEDRGRYFKQSDFDSNKIFQLPLSILETSATSNEHVSAFSKYESGRDSETTSLTNCLYELMDGVLSRKLRKFISEHPDTPDEETPEREQFNRGLVRDCMNFVLSDFATNVCGLVAAISANANDARTYVNLCELLSDYRVTSTNCAACAKALGSNSICVVCDSFERHPQFGKEVSHVCTARFGIGIKACTREFVDKEQEKRSRSKAGVLLVVVLGTLGAMILSRRGADSVVGFWLGLTLLVNAGVVAGAASGMSSELPDYVKFEIWERAFFSPIYSLLAAGLAIIKSLNVCSMWVGTLAQSVLFVILCWPTLKCMGKWKRQWSFVGKTVLVFGVACSAGVAIGALVLNVGEMTDAVLRMLVIMVLGAWGWALRRTRRQYTEVPRLGFLFFMGWLALEAALTMFMAWTGNSLLEDSGNGWLPIELKMPIFGDCELGMLLCGGLPVCALACWVLLFVRQKFLNVLSFGGIMVILAAFALPVTIQLFDFSDYIVSAADNVFVSRSGMRIILAIVVVAVAPWVAKTLRKICRYVFMHDVYKMEQDVAASLEKVFDESAEKSESICKVLSCVKINSFVFYERVTRDEFRRIGFKNWAEGVPEMMSMSTRLRQRLGTKRELLDFSQLPYSSEWFFESFELWRLHLLTNGALMLPICLGTSVRGLLFVGARDVVDIPTDRSLVGSINSFGLSSMTPR